LLRDWWENCAGEMDEEILTIDALEDEISPLNEETIRTRRLITSLELCHHKAERWVELIIEAISSGKATRGPVGEWAEGLSRGDWNREEQLD
jgi:hypothetical protein